MAKNYSGRDFLLYLGTTAPTSATDSGDANYNLVGLVQNLSINTSRNAIDKSSKTDGDESSFISGRRNSTLSGTAIWDHTADTGQAVLTTALEAADGTVYFLVSSTTAGDQEFHGSGVITSRNLSWPDEDVSSIDFEIQVSGALTEVLGTTT